MADVGQEEDFAAAEKKALKVGAKKFFLEVWRLSRVPFYSNFSRSSGFET
jgi:argininosuccinate synthase